MDPSAVRVSGVPLVGSSAVYMGVVTNAVFLQIGKSDGNRSSSCCRMQCSVSPTDLRVPSKQLAFYEFPHDTGRLCAVC